ncbi:uncharacterized protein BDW43DRAFT_270666 [Aspergillus alliaceus]|uniref:uncharacterized protein n=1 Tax=Petromyces alliaceus TaxID=209559 RepID=UPI0012A3B2A7|nr:uncharacterized protein BDW43DRAFT_270666 [Aspergillus alliaceus]KAB8235549.1 hypothetical protein BDW43DRAFT_270666 [Aspergillus alliaceus]
MGGEFRTDSDQDVGATSERNTMPDKHEGATPNLPKLKHSDYTVGWVTAVQPEYIAARAFLDEQHAPPDF